MKFLLILALLLLAGCTMRPPSASAFMGAYQTRNGTSGPRVSFSASKYHAFKPDSTTMAEAGYDHWDWDDVVAEEWTVDLNFALHYFIRHFEIGTGFQWMNPYVTVGFASDHFGVMGWTDWRILAGFKSMGAGVSVMEQISPVQKMQLGLMQFVSQSWGFYTAGFDDVKEPYSYGFREVGAGIYMLYSGSEKYSANFELKYSYDWVWNANRLAFSLGISM